MLRCARLRAWRENNVTMVSYGAPAVVARTALHAGTAQAGTVADALDKGRNAPLRAVVRRFGGQWPVQRVRGPACEAASADCVASAGDSHAWMSYSSAGFRCVDNSEKGVTRCLLLRRAHTSGDVKYAPECLLVGLHSRPTATC
jgi:hypothetical protein